MEDKKYKRYTLFSDYDLDPDYNGKPIEKEFKINTEDPRELMAVLKGLGKYKGWQLTIQDEREISRLFVKASY